MTATVTATATARKAAMLGRQWGAWLAALCLCAGGSAAADAPAPKLAPTPAFYGVYLKNVKIGALTLTRNAQTRFAGRLAVRTDTRLTLDLQVAGRPTQVVSESASYVEWQTGLPLQTDARTASGGAQTRVQATYTPQSVSYVAHVTGSERKATLALKPGEQFLIDPVGAGVKISVGQRWSGKVFQADPAQLTLAEGRLDVVAREIVSIGGKPTAAFRVEDKNPSAPVTMHLTEDGELLRTQSAQGLRIERQDRSAALAPSAPADLGHLASIVPSGSLAGLRRAPAARYELRGLTRPLPPSDILQQVSLLTQPGAAQVIVTPVPLPSTPTAPRFGRAADAPAALQKFLSPTFYVNSDAPQFQALARRIVGNETDLARAARKIARHVHQSLRFDPTISNLRTSLDVRRDPKGVCRDYTLYFTALARAAGIPTKQCVGVALADGRFSGHAWPEVWTGSLPDGRDRWVALEPTWGEAYADATHIKLSEGEITDFFAVASDLGRLSITVLPMEAP